MNLIERIDQWGVVNPNRLAHLSGERSLTYRELSLRSDRLAVYLAQALPNDHSPVAVLGHKEPEMLIAFLGAVKAGHAYVPMDTSIPPQRVERIVASAGVKLTLTPDRVSASTENPIERTLDPVFRVKSDDPFYIIFTSGSTGEPKGVIITLRCLTSFLDWMLMEQHFQEVGETFLNQAPFSFDLSVMDLYCCLASGGTLFSISRDDQINPAQLYRVLARSDVTVWVSTPSFAQLCLADRNFTPSMLPHLRRFLFCGETLAPETASALLDRFTTAEVWNTYGPTEATVATTSIRIDRAALARYHPLPVGYPKPDSRILIMREDGHAMATGERGEIVIAGANVSPGYIGRPDLTANAFFELDGTRAYHTGDWGRFRDGLLFFEGRRDNQIKLHGHRIELGDVEANLQTLPGVRDSVVVVKYQDGTPEYLAAFVILDEPGTDSEFQITQSLRNQLAQRLPAYMVPRKIHFVLSFPMTPNGKADRRKLAELLV